MNEIEDHCIPIALDKCFNQTLTLEDIDSFFVTMLDMQHLKRPEEVKSSNSSGTNLVPI